MANSNFCLSDQGSPPPKCILLIRYLVPCQLCHLLLKQMHLIRQLKCDKFRQLDRANSKSTTSSMHEIILYMEEKELQKIRETKNYRVQLETATKEEGSK